MAKTKVEKEAEVKAAADAALAAGEGAEVVSELEPVAANVGTDATVPAPVVAKGTAKAKITSLKVRVPGNVPAGPVGGTVRVFSADDHGDSFQDEAEKYRVRYNGEYVK